MALIESKRNREILRHDVRIVKFWRCRRKYICPARVHTSLDNLKIIILPAKEHTHDSESIEIEANIVVTKMKRRAIETTETTSTIINECVNGLTQSAKEKTNNEVNSAPAAPIDLKTLQLPEIYKTYSPNDGISEQFLLADSGHGTDRVLIFGRLSGLKILKNSRTWYCDGTFRIAPLLFSQAYVILAEALGGVLPVIYALLPSKKANVYKKLLNMLKTLEPDLNPDSISCDFELAAFTAIKNAFPNVQIFGCYFHLCQNFRSKLGELHLISRYKNEPEFCIHVKSIIALAFVPISDLDDALEILSESLPEELIDLLDWFEDFYIGRKNRSREDRTNNHAEAVNRRLNQLMANKPTIWAFINTLRTIQAGTDTQYEHLVTGNSPRKKLKKFRDTDNRIYKLVDRYDKNDIQTFIRGISNNIAYN
ncbi:hypothetical protein AGLY_008197 [Aphis glycines]|uniref:MULE transposase domain-containing protein n=1 Tax=Aphis glycines TaxID=307491 RepID=A0A6G0TL50_APHGL|nr:hypothetical protein AGLY_008197 [Aphis glycines]